jgi:hypothetical protein
VLWNRTDTFSSFILCTLQTIRMSLTWRMKILTGCGRYKICFKFWTWHFQNFMVLLNIWPQMKVLFCTKEG